MGRDTSFTYTLDVEFADADAGIAQIRIDVPAPAVLEEIAGLEGSALEAWDSTRDPTHHLLGRAAASGRPVANSL